MKNFKKWLVIGLSTTIALGSVFGTIAYLQDSTESVKAIFTYGKVNIMLSESVVDAYGNIIGATTDRAFGDQAYKLVPGRTYIKDPVITVEGGSEQSYIYVYVGNGLIGYEDEENASDGSQKPSIDTQLTQEGWTKLLDTGSVILGCDEAIYYKSSGLIGEEDTDLRTFSKFTVDGLISDFTDEIELLKGRGSIDIKAYAVQEQGFSSAQEAWLSTFGA